jgi:cytidylate kinase
MTIITIRGQLGSGAPEIGQLLASRLHMDYVDREIIARVAEELRRHEIEIEEKEAPETSLSGKIAEALSYGYAMGPYSTGMYLPAWNIPLNRTGYLKGLETVIRKLAERNSIVIRGRGSQFILKDFRDTIHILVLAPFEIRLARVMKDLNLNKDEASKEIERFDSSRHEFIKRYFKAEIEDPVNYDLVINTKKLDVDAAVTLIIGTLNLIKEPSHV